MARLRSASGASPPGGHRQRPGEAGSAAVAWFGRTDLVRALGGVLLLVAAGAAQAALFEDEEARKAILDLRARIQASEDASSKRNAELAKANTQLAEQLQQLRSSLLDLNAQLEAQRNELAKLRGTQEQLARDTAELQRRQKDVVQGVDERLRKLEPQPVTLDGKEFFVEPDERRAHDEAMATLRGGDFAKAATQLGAFLKRYPSSGYARSARFWYGNALYGKKDYKEAIVVFRALVTEAPDHPRAPEALLSVANCQLEMKDPRSARRTLDEVVKAYPSSEAAVAARERLGSIKG